MRRPRFKSFFETKPEDKTLMRYLRKLTALGLTAFLFFAMATVFSQMPAETENSDQSRTVRTILLITSYPVADVVTSNFFDSFR